MLQKGHKINLGRKQTKEHIEKVKLSNIGKKRTKQTCINISNSLKGRKVWNKGVNMSDETKNKIREKALNRKHSEKTKQKIKKAIIKLGLKPPSPRNRIVKESTKIKLREINKNRKVTWGNKISSSLIGHEHSETTKEKMSKSKKGERHWNWQNGKSFEPYGLEFNDDLKEVIRNRDRRKCQICKKTELEEKRQLSIHHIDYDKKNNDPKNLITLCTKCHIKTNYKRDYWINYFKNIINI